MFGLVSVTASISPLTQTVERVACRHRRRILARTPGHMHLGRSPQPFAQQLPPLSGLGEQHPAAAAALEPKIGQSLGVSVRRPALGRGLGETAARASAVAGPMAASKTWCSARTSRPTAFNRLKNAFYSVGTCEDEPVVFAIPESFDSRVGRGQSGRGPRIDDRQQGWNCPEEFQPADERQGLRARPGHEHPHPPRAAGLEPRLRRLERDGRADQQQRRPTDAGLADRCFQG